jgi:capsular exopolysaccharide synthesis family protein
VILVLKRRKQKNQKEPPLIVHGDPKAIGSEAFRTLRTNLQFTSPDRELKTILLTSAGPGEGKSTVSGNLAIAFAQLGQKVVLVGCDLRKPVLHQMFSVANAPGLTGHLTGQASLDDAILRSRIDGLDVIPSGPVPPNPAELLQSKAMNSVIAQLKERYDIVIFDGAPVIAVTDSAIMASKVDGTVLVMRAHAVPRDVALHAKTLLEQANARILGVVLNGVRPQDQKNYHYYYYYDEAE